MMELFIELHDHAGVVHDELQYKFGNESTLDDVKQIIHSEMNIDRKYQQLFIEDGQKLVGAGEDSLQSLGLKHRCKVIVKHSALKDWVNFLSLCDVVNDTKADRNDQKASACLAIDLSAKLESSKFLLAYSGFGTTWVQKRGQAMRSIDRLLPAFKESAKAFFASLDPESTVEFEAKTVGIMSGTIAKVTNGDTLTRYYLKTYHRSRTAKIISTSDRFPPNLIETFVYRFLNYLDTGPDVYFPYYSKSIYIHFIMTKQVDGFQELQQVKDPELQIKIVVEAYILRLILGITDLNSGNFGVDKRNILSIIDFCPPQGDHFLRREITNDFKNGNKIDEFDVNEILREIRPEKRIEIAKVALDRWIGIRTVTSNLIDNEKAFLRRHGINFDNGTSDVENYIKDIKANFETLRSGLQ